ncbi:MAG: integrase [Altererythrobacter sp.]|nr:integrase [Altererythrobacter sp.]MBK63007.1 integrase [Altererythrobacter sp.]MBK63095.1 integrase [Altererythrobacter sp.]|tara:strand:+ start:3216 stop:4283 length:1068 start_codon:yes stop_codon:yes gene_type:complete
MRVRLKGINRVKKRLADGSHVIYYYAWKGGPRLEGSPGSAEFVDSYNLALKNRRVKPDGTLQSVLRKFLESPIFLKLADTTRKGYSRHIRAIEDEFGDFPLAALSDARTRGEFLEWRDKIGLTSPREADYRFSVLARVLSWAVDRGYAPANPCKNPGRLYHSERVDSVWTPLDETNFYERAPKHLHLALMLALWTGQRQGDLLTLTWAGYDGKFIRLTQKKTNRRVVIPVGAPLRCVLDALKSETVSRMGNASALSSLTILTTTRGTAWTKDGFRASWRKACAKAGVADVTFHDLRGTAVTRLALAGCTPPEIATLTGHSLKDVNEILDAHYLSRDSQLAESAIRKLEKRAESPN